MIKKSLLLVVCALFLSGCTVKLPGSVPLPTPKNTDSPNTFTQKKQPGSFWKSNDGGKTFEVKSRVDEKRSITSADVLSLSFHPNDPKIVYAGTVDNGIFKTVDSGETWQPIVFPPKKIYSFILDKNDPDKTMFASGVINGFAKIFRTEDGGTEWKAVYSEPEVKTVITVLAQNPHNNKILFAGTSTGTVIKSADGGDTWKNIGKLLDGPITDMAFDSWNAPSLYVLSFNKQLYYSADDGATFTDWGTDGRQSTSSGRKTPYRNNPVDGSTTTVQPDTSAPGTLLSLVADPSISGRVYVSKIGGLFRSNDFGKTWEEINIIESTKKLPIRAVAINPHDSKEIIFAAGSAFYKSVNEGDTWAVVDLFIDRGVSVLGYDRADPSTIYMALRKL